MSMRNIIKRILKEETDYLPQDHKIIKTIKKIIGNKYEDYYYDHNTWNDDAPLISYKINFHLKKVSIWKVTDEDRENIIYWGGNPIYKPKEESQYEGLLYIKLDNVVKYIEGTGEYERVYEMDEIADVAWEDFQEYLTDEVNKWLPIVHVDSEISF
jgi:hypothetical protein